MKKVSGTGRINDQKEKEIAKNILLAMLRTLTDSERLAIFHEFCVYCGNADRPCYCTRDD